MPFNACFLVSFITTAQYCTPLYMITLCHYVELKQDAILNLVHRLPVSTSNNRSLSALHLQARLNGLHHSLVSLHQELFLVNRIWPFVLTTMLASYQTILMYLIHLIAFSPLELLFKMLFVGVLLVHLVLLLVVMYCCAMVPTRHGQLALLLHGALLRNGRKTDNKWAWSREKQKGSRLLTAHKIKVSQASTLTFKHFDPGTVSSSTDKSIGNGFRLPPVERRRGRMEFVSFCKPFSC